MTRRQTLVIGANGYVGRHLVPFLKAHNRDVTCTPRITDLAQLQRLVQSSKFEQIISLPQLSKPIASTIAECVDGNRWLVFSSAQLTNTVSGPGKEEALQNESLCAKNGAVVLRPTMIFGRGEDQNISKIINMIRRWHLCILVANGEPLVQPIHIDDILQVTQQHATHSIPSGIYELGGSESVPSAELLTTLKEIIGTRTHNISISPSLIHRASPLAHIARLRPDQLQRLLDDKVVDIEAARSAFQWTPRPLAHCLEQAVREVAA